LAAALFAGACALGVWQIHRLAWKRNLIAQAATELGSGYWVMTPLRLDGGGTVLVNRGFVLPEWRRQQSAGDAARP
ncbi:SURF1 family cytochrome oxidase biogenesis protein, partial [Bordetella pertussis]